MSDYGSERSSFPIALPQSPWRSFLPSPSEMVEYDAATIAEGTSALQLMENAGKALFGEISGSFKTLPNDSQITILAGPGNNGGDGAVLARMFHEAGRRVTLVVSAARRFSSELRHNLERYLAVGGAVYLFGSASEELLPLQAVHEVDEARFKDLLCSSALLIDALLGTGQRLAPSGTVAQMIHLLNGVPNHPLLFSIDCPTGVNAETGEVYTPCISAARTLCLELIKRGLVQSPAREACGVLSAVSIGVRCDPAPEFELLLQERLLLSARPRAMHKGDAGRVWVLGGSPNMPGATMLAALGALHAGAGLVYRVQPRSLPLPIFTPEVITALVSDSHGELTAASFAEIEQRVDYAQSVVLGPGLGESADAEAFFKSAVLSLSKARVATVLDADGLNFLPALLRSTSEKIDLSRFVLTPHPGEMARLLGCEVSEVQRDRYTATIKLSALTGAVVVLKGASTIVYAQGRGAVNLLGNPYMATAGSGDVLSGVIAAMLAREPAAFTAAARGVFVHARAGDLAHTQSGGPILASQIAFSVARAVGEITERSETMPLSH